MTDTNPVHYVVQCESDCQRYDMYCVVMASSENKAHLMAREIADGISSADSLNYRVAWNPGECADTIIRHREAVDKKFAVFADMLDPYASDFEFELASELESLQEKILEAFYKRNPKLQHC